MKIFWASLFLVMISGASWADDFFNPPPLNPELPPWMQNQQEQNQPNQNNQQPQPPQQATPDTSTPSAEAPSFDSGSDEEDGGSPFDFESGSEGGGGGGTRDTGKPSFQVVEPNNPTQQNQQDCVGWGNSFLGTKIFSNESSCKNELEQDIENARDSINNYVDYTEKEVLRGVIRGKIDREKSKDFQLDFTILKNSLVMAAKNGCSCLE